MIVCKFPTRGEKYLCGCAAGKYLRKIYFSKLFNKSWILFYWPTSTNNWKQILTCIAHFWTFVILFVSLENPSKNASFMISSISKNHTHSQLGNPFKNAYFTILTIYNNHTCSMKEIPLKTDLYKPQSRVNSKQLLNSELSWNPKSVKLNQQWYNTTLEALYILCDKKSLNGIGLRLL